MDMIVIENVWITNKSSQDRLILRNYYLSFNMKRMPRYRNRLNIWFLLEFKQRMVFDISKQSGNYKLLLLNSIYQKRTVSIKRAQIKYKQQKMILRWKQHRLSQYNKQQNILILLLLFGLIYFFQSMASLVNYHHFPRVSLAKLYESYTSSNNTSKIEQGVVGRAHNDDIKIQSPFYQKHQLHKGPCSCAYHRMKRYKQKGIIKKCDPNTKMKNAINQYKFRIAAAVKAAGQSAKNNMQQIFNTQKIERPFRNTQNKKISRCGSVSQAPYKTKVDLDNYNHFFEQVLRKRMSPIQDHDKVANLIRFIKLQNTYDPKYLAKTKDYIYMHLLKIVQKIPWNQLSNIDENDANMIKLIAQISNCKQQFALQLLNGIKKAIKDFEGFIAQRMNQKLCQQQANSSGGALKSHGKDNIQNKNAQKLFANQNGLDYFNQEGNLIDSRVVDTFDNKQNILGSLDQFTNKNNRLRLDGLGNHLGNSRHQSLLNSLSSSSRKKGMPLNSKKSNIILQPQKLSGFGSLGNTLKAFETPTISQQSSQQIITKEKNQQNLLKRQSKDIISNLHEKGNFRRSKFNPNCTNKSSDIGDNQQSYDGKNYQNGNSKDRKGQLHNKRRQSKQIQTPCPFKNVNYAKLVSKEEFERIKHILNDNRSAYADEQRMKKLFQYIQRRISGNPQFFEQFLTKFQGVLTPDQIILLKQKYQKYEFQKMIYKLTKQVDSCLLELKNTDELLWKQQQEDDIKGDRNGSLTKKTINLECIQSDIGLIQQFQKFTVIQSNAPPIPIQQDTQLQQIGLGQIQLQQFQAIPEAKFKSLYDKCYKIKAHSKQHDEFDWKNSIINEQKHRKILRYMKSKYPSAFNEVKENIHGTLDLNNSSVL